ncbi:MAG: hypothetical protein EBU90_26850, partial [Proteobacteria bacterium]|nr:hypothetical protein [Pseudomonadota bacterium]
MELGTRDYQIGNDKNYDDVLNVGVFKLRQSVFQNDPKLLIADQQEFYTGSFTDTQRQIAAKNGGTPTNYYIGNIINGKSSNISVLINPYINNTANDGLGKGSSYNTNTDPITLKKIRIINRNMVNNFTLLSAYVGGNTTISTLSSIVNSIDYGDSLTPLGTFSDEGYTDKSIGNVPAKVDRALDKVRNDELFDISVVVEGGLGTIYSYTKTANTVNYDDTAFNSTYFGSLSSLQVTSQVTTNTVRDNYMSVFTKFGTFANTYQNGGRGDVFFVADPIRHLYVTGANSKVIDDPSKSFAQHIYWGTKNLYDLADSSYISVYANWMKVSDDYSGQIAWVPSSGFAAAKMATTDSLVGPWNAPAGFNRGVISDAIDIAFAPNQRQRDDLYKAAFNPIATFPGQGIVIFGQKTLQKKPSAFDRVNVRRLF